MIEISDPSLSYREFPGPVLLLAGPGTGKTWQLAMRAKFLIEERGGAPEEIALITFTNEAARNMRDQFRNRELRFQRRAGPD
jgi:DNA helicase II / ATP-dependent DNA helicase PcrA